MSPLEVRDPGLHDLVAPDAAIERIAGGLDFTEGPVWRGGRICSSATSRTSASCAGAGCPKGPELTTFATGMSNGLTLDRQGRVLAAEHDGRRVTRVADDGTRTVLAEQLPGQAAQQPQRHRGEVRRRHLLHRPAVRRAAGAARHGAARRAGGPSPFPGKEQPCHGVYRLDPRRHAAPGGGRLRAAERPRLLARRVRALHRRLRPQAHPRVRRAPGRHR